MTDEDDHPSEKFQLAVSEFSGGFYAVLGGRYPFFLCLWFIFYAIIGRCPTSTALRVVLKKYCRLKIYIVELMSGFVSRIFIRVLSAFTSIQLILKK